MKSNYQFGLTVYMLTKCKTITGKALIIAQHIPVNGYVGILSEDCRVLLSRETVKTRKFNTETQGIYYMIMEWLEEKEVRNNDVVILKNELEKFENKHDLKPKNICKVVNVYKVKAPTKPHQNNFLYENDFRCVKFKEYQFDFGDIQASIIKQLYDAGKTDNPWLHGKTLLHNAGSTSMVMRDIFRHKENWRELIHSNKRGYYRLHPSCISKIALADTQEEELEDD